MYQSFLPDLLHDFFLPSSLLPYQQNDLSSSPSDSHHRNEIVKTQHLSCTAPTDVMMISWPEYEDSTREGGLCKMELSTSLLARPGMTYSVIALVWWMSKSPDFSHLYGSTGNQMPAKHTRLMRCFAYSFVTFVYVVLLYRQ